ncbi:hypothetical protein G8759_32010 [Spirosoma aureum]|uniref:Uncharacterized protein n=1 Tax=Spirosoma aureum TaxID=2692134 RepID=A0A6G9AX35_9BACT|nr:hypothetical protein [Spirosoma aureum]QIP16934.1 hypothetical protein G8759_32010 [Spirosoma aureum]
MRTDTHPDIPLLPQVDNASIRVDSLPDTMIRNFIFSADKTKIYAIVLTASTGVFAEHTLVEFDQAGHRLRQLPFGEMSIQEMELALLQPNLLLWEFSGLFYRVDLDAFKVVDKVHAFWTGNYPDDQKEKDWVRVDREGQAWYRQKKNEIGQQFDIQEADSITLAVLKGNKTNADAYWEAIRKARSDLRTQFEPDRHKAYYEAYALARMRAGKSSFAYRSPDNYASYVFTKFADGNTTAFTLDEAFIQKAGVKFHPYDVNTRVVMDRSNANTSLSEGRFTLVEGQSVTDRTSVLQLTEGITAKYGDLMWGGNSFDEFLFYFDLKLGKKTARFKWIYPLALSNDFYLQSANGSVYVLKAGVLYWFHV